MTNFRNFYFLTILLGASLFAACSSDSAPTNNAANANARSSVSSNINAAAAPANVASAASPVAAPSAPPASGSPSATVVAFYQAWMKKDENTFRRTLSQATVQEFLTEGKAENINSTLGYWTSISEKLPPSLPEVRNERIAGETATIEIKDPETGKWTPTSLVRENGEWKLDYTLDTSMRNMQNAK
jgi:3-oxoacyl-ACP reductase-like protein